MDNRGKGGSTERGRLSKELRGEQRDWLRAEESGITKEGGEGFQIDGILRYREVK